jgi:hypothetical protein
MVVVGDTAQVFLYAITNSGDYEKIASLTG